MNLLNFRNDEIKKDNCYLLLSLFIYFLILLFIFRLSIPYFFNVSFLYILIEPSIKFVSLSERYFVMISELEVGKIIYEIASTLVLITLAVPLTFIFLTINEDKNNFLKSLYSIFLTLLTFLIIELVQAFTRLGVFEVYDLVCYFIGSIIASFFYIKLRKRVRTISINKLVFSFIVFFIVTVVNKNIALVPTIFKIITLGAEGLNRI